MGRAPEVRLADDGKHIVWSHECNFEDLVAETGLWHGDVMLPIHDTRGWRVEQVEPLTVSPSILCGSCGTHGFWRDGAWAGV